MVPGQKGRYRQLSLVSLLCTGKHGKTKIRHQRHSCQFFKEKETAKCPKPKKKIAKAKRLLFFLSRFIARIIFKSYNLYNLMFVSR